MGTFSIKKGRDIRLKGAAEKKIVSINLPQHVAMQPQDFRGLHPRLSVKVGDTVKVGSTLFADKAIPEIQVASPASGKIVAVNRGAKRALLSIVVETDGHQDCEVFPKFSEDQIKSISKADVTEALLNGKLWPVIRQRPFSKIADPHTKPKSIFVHAMNTEPMALDIDFILDGREKEFQIGLDLLGRLTDGSVHLCTAKGSRSKALTQANRVQTHTFEGPHPAGNVSTHIHYVDAINKGDVVWYVEAQDVLRIASLFLNGTYPTERIIAVTGEGAANSRIYAKTVIGTPIAALLGNGIPDDVRCISGSVLNGREVGHNGYVQFYDSQVSIVLAGGHREFLGWLMPGLGKYSFSKTFASSFLPEREVALDTDEHGSHRAMVFNHIYDSLVPLDIMTYFLIKAVLSGNVEESEELGILECDEEDFALCTFACPSKTDVGGIIAKGLALIESEG